MFGKPEDSKLLKDDKGRWRLRSLFYEMTTPAQRKEFTPLFTLKEEDLTIGEVTYKSMRRVFIESNDPTEYEVAQECLGSWKHWKVLINTNWFGPHIEEWREELEVSLRSQAVKAMRKTATEEGSKGTTAAKYLASKGWDENRGRPSKKAVEQEAKIQSRIKDELDDDLERMKDIVRPH